VLRRTWVLVVVAMVAGSLLAACGGDDDGGSGRAGGGSSSGGSGKADQPLEGTEWILDQRATKLTTVTPSAVINAQFSSDGTLSGSSGCNRYNASYSVEGSSMTIGQPAGTLIACAAPVMRVEQAYLARLPKATSFSIDGAVLTIETKGGRPLVYDALDPEKAVAGNWVVTGYFRPGAIVSPVAGSNLTARFAAGQISGDSGCNQYSGPYEVDGTKIAIGPLASTLRACADPAVDQQEREFLAALELARTFSVDGTGLTLLREDGGIAVTFQPA